MTAWAFGPLTTIPFFFSSSNSVQALSPMPFCKPISKSSEAPDSAGSGVVTLSLNASVVRSCHSLGSGVPLLVFHTIPSAEIPCAT
ncbi:hypothetical protein D3C78_1396970 [compost metagenome]